MSRWDGPLEPGRCRRMKLETAKALVAFGLLGQLDFTDLCPLIASSLCCSPIVVMASY